MKIVKLSLIIVAAAAVMFGLSSVSFAFHSGGVAECTGCHEMHGANASSLLIGHDVSSTCLTCHGKPKQSSYHILSADSDMPTGMPPVNQTPGGDFGWLKKTYYYSAHGSPGTELGMHHGHSIVASDFGLSADTDNTVAPGGTFISANLHCNSCHDQHGQVRMLSTLSFATTGAPIIGSGSYGTSATPAAGEAVGTYRLLRSKLSDQNHAQGSPDFSSITTPVLAWAPGTYNRSEFYTQTRVEYNSSMSDYCGACHPGMHSDAGILRHPQGQIMSSTIVNNYNAYVKSGDMTGSSATSYLSLVPFEENMALNATNLPTLKAKAVNDDTHLEGPSATGMVMCLSCHRAHASGWAEMTRWDNETEFIVRNGAYPANEGKTTFETAGAYYNKDVTKFATYQRSLCNKCHAKD